MYIGFFLIHLVYDWANRYIAPEQVPIQYGGLSVDFCDCNPAFTNNDPASEITIKPATKQTVEILVNEVRLQYPLVFIIAVNCDSSCLNTFICILLKFLHFTAYNCFYNQTMHLYRWFVNTEVHYHLGIAGSRLGSELQC